MDKRRILIFDFDGTIADTTQLWFRTVNSLSSQFNYSPISEAELESLKNKGVKEVLRAKNIPFWRMTSLVDKAREIIGEKMNYVDPIRGMAKVIESAKKSGHIVAIITSNTENNVRSFLNLNNIRGVDYIEGGGSLFSKHAKILRVLRNMSIPSSHAFYIGDEVRDIHAAHKAGVKAVAVTWGFNSHAILSKSKPDHLINNSDELVRLLCSA